MTSFDITAFENSARQNGQRYWFANEFMRTLGYESWASFRSVVNKAIGLCSRIGVDVIEAIIPVEVIDDSGKAIHTYKLTSFGCLLVTMQADVKKIEVAQAQVAMAAIADALVDKYLNSHTLERIERREELKIAENILSGKANAAGVQSTEFGIFKSAGFRGMYNMTLDDLKNYKGVACHKGTLYDLMGITELAANTFRVTQTAERLKHTGASGLKQATSVAHQVGKEVRDVMIKSNGTAPEDLALEEDMNSVQKGIRTAHKEIKRIDNPVPAKKQKKLKH
jgi:DNA-damage-inducible protein D